MVLQSKKKRDSDRNGGDMVRRLSVIAALLLAVTLSTRGFGQSTSATVSGTVEDGTRALIPGVTVTAKNNATGIVSTAVSKTDASPLYLMLQYTIRGIPPDIDNA